MNQRDLDELARQLAARLTCSRKDPLTANIAALLPGLLLEGRPVPLRRVAEILGVRAREVSRALSPLPDVELDSEGRIVGAGITLVPTPHRFTVGGRLLFAWCAWDTLTYPLLLQRTAEVQSRCADTGLPIRMIVTPEQVRNVEPATAVISIIADGGCAGDCSIRGSFCDHVHFFRSERAGAQWSAQHPAGVLLTIAQAFELGHEVRRALDVAKAL